MSFKTWKSQSAGRLTPASGKFRLLSPALFLFLALPALADSVYGPVNLLKTMKTPFGAPSGPSEQSNSDPLAELSLTSTPPEERQRLRPLSLAERLVPSRVFLPGRIVLGKEAEFIVKAKPNAWVALAMADKNSGAKPIYGHPIRLGPDRRLVSVGQIPETGVLSMVIQAPIEGDVGDNLYFEAAIWSKPDFSDIQIATPIAAETNSTGENGVLVAADSTEKKGIRITTHDPVVPLSQREIPGTRLESGKP